MLFESDLLKAHMPKDKRIELVKGLPEDELVQSPPVSNEEPEVAVIQEAVIRKRKKKRGTLTSARNQSMN
jgi:hypothetical protein